MTKPNPDIWDEPEMLHALAHHDITTVYRLVCQARLSQTQIGQLTGQSQSEVSEILSGRRVLSYAVLERIALGLGIPRGHMGLAYADAHGDLETYAEDDGYADPEVDDEMISRRFLGLSSAALLGETVLNGPIMQLGTNLLGEPGGVRLLIGSDESHGTLGKQDVAWIKNITERLWTLDLQYGGASIFGAARGTAVQVVGALHNSPPNRELQLAASDLCRVAAWTAFDAGHKRTFWQYHATALDLAREAGDTATIISIISAAGRAEILSGNHQAAAKLFELLSIRKEPDAVAWGLLGSAYAPNSPNSARGALKHLRSAEGADTLDATAMIGHVSVDIGDYQTAVVAFDKVVPQRSGRLAVQETAPLAIACLQTGERSTGIQYAERLLELSEDVRSSKCIEALRPLGRLLAAQDDSTAQDLARRIASVSA